MKFQVSKTSPLPLHVQLLDELRHSIISGTLQPHDRLPGEWELVEQLGISRATIQRAWQAALDEGLIYRVVGKGTYVAEPRSMRHGLNAVGFLIPEYRSTFAMKLLSGAENTLRTRGYSMMFAHTDRLIHEENRLLQEMSSRGVCGFLLVPTKSAVADRYLASTSFTTPVVLLDRPIPDLPHLCVTSDNYAGAQQAMQHLIDLGHRRIAFLSRPQLEMWTINERYRAYQDALRAVNALPDAPLLIGTDTELSSHEAHLLENTAEIEPLVEVLQRPDRPTAIFAVNDWVALRALHAAEQVGLTVPNELSIVGFDNLDVTEYTRPPLTTVEQDGTAIGAEAARRLLQLIEGTTSTERFVMLPTRLIVRQSTAGVKSTN